MALSAYRWRLSELEAEVDEARAMGDLGRAHRALDEREALAAELRSATRPGGAAAMLGSTAAERARKAVTARIRDAIRRIALVLPNCAGHLDRSVQTGTLCRYLPRD